MEKRKIAIIIGSKSDLNQCVDGLQFLKKCKSESEIEIIGIYVRSQHRNTLQVQLLLQELEKNNVNIIITGAGWANHLSGCCDAYLRYELKNTKIVILGVAFEDPLNGKHTLAAELAISEVPGTQVVYEEKTKQFIGSKGFLNACIFAVAGKLPEIKLPAPKPPMDLTLEEAIEIVS
jgi:phosphoribosylcarboxyaminoimidazole (NCAIR) mutase